MQILCLDQRCFKLAMAFFIGLSCNMEGYYIFPNTSKGHRQG